MVDLMDPSPYPKNRRLTAEEFVAATKSMTPEEIAVRVERLLWFCNQIIDISLRTMPREQWLRWKGSIGLDATPIPAFARAQVKDPDTGEVVIYSAEPDGAWYVREGDHRDLDAMPDSAGKVIKKLKKQKWAFELSIAIMGPSCLDDDRTFPYLIAGMAVLHKPGHAPGENAVKMLANMHQRGLPADLIGCDRAYTGQKPENYRLPAAALGHQLVIDYKIDELGIMATWGGANLVEGRWYCPSMPTLLVTATADLRAGLITKDLWYERIEARRAYELRPKAAPDAEGHVRLLCPAAGTHPTAMCDLKKGSTSRHMLGKTAVILTTDVADDPPKVCTQQSVTFPPEAGDRYLQALPYGTPEWQRTYATLRNTIEGVNGLIKDGSYEALADSTKRRVRGVAANSVLVAFGIFALNLRKIDSFCDLAVVDTNGTLRKPRKRRRTTKPIQNWAPATSSGDPPPSA
ncbi:MAG: hypothetical protein KF703_08390 [Actinobacteria bacterium]|nr:hypothetical protein [Actinomycetota bacterium]